MGNTCVGPNLGNGFLKSVTAAVWPSRPPEERLAPSEDKTDSKSKTNSSSDSDPQSGVQDFACKTIAKRKLRNKEDVEDVRREIHIMHHLAGHSNVIQIVGAFEDAVENCLIGLYRGATIQRDKRLN